MRSMSSLVAKLANNHPGIAFTIGNTARWSRDEQTVYHNPGEPHADWVLLHETAHALLDHSDYARDIELLALEREAWEYASHTLAPDYGVCINPAFINEHLDTYRDWLHAKSTCPACQSNGYESSPQQYACVHCGGTWHTNTGVDREIRRFQTV